MELGLQGKVALVTGAGSQIGFGKAIALSLAREGCDIAVNDVDLGGARKTASEVESLGRKALAIKADVTNSREVADMVNTILNTFGSLDILVNNAGACAPPKPFLKMTEEEWNRDININLNGTMNCTRAVLPHMIEKKIWQNCQYHFGCWHQWRVLYRWICRGKGGCNCIHHGYCQRGCTFKSKC